MAMVMPHRRARQQYLCYLTLDIIVLVPIGTQLHGRDVIFYCIIILVTLYCFTLKLDTGHIIIA